MSTITLNLTAPTTARPARLHELLEKRDELRRLVRASEGSGWELDVAAARMAALRHPGPDPVADAAALLRGEPLPSVAPPPDHRRELRAVEAALHELRMAELRERLTELQASVAADTAVVAKANQAALAAFAKVRTAVADLGDVLRRLELAEAEPARLRLEYGADGVTVDGLPPVRIDGDAHRLATLLRHVVELVDHELARTGQAQG